MTAWLCLLPRGGSRTIRSRSRQSAAPLPPPGYRDDIIVTHRSLPDDARLSPIRSYALSRRPAAPGRSTGPGVACARGPGYSAGKVISARWLARAAFALILAAVADLIGFADLASLAMVAVAAAGACLMLAGGYVFLAHRGCSGGLAPPWWSWPRSRCW